MSNSTNTDPIQDHDERIEKTKETQFLSASILVMLALMTINIVSQRILRNLRGRYPQYTRFIQEATIPTLSGLIAGMILKFGSFNGILDQIRDGYESLFMIVLLPPIIFESAINMQKRYFFSQIGSIVCFAIFGTLLATVITGVFLKIMTYIGLANGFSMIQCFAFGAIVSSTDPVSVLAIFKEMNANKVLYSLIFGESILNDAFVVTFYRILSTMYLDNEKLEPIIVILKFSGIFFGSIALGWVVGMICALILKKYFSKVDDDDNNNQENTETLIMMLLPWVSYLIGEGCYLSGIVTIMFCGISMAKYCVPNLSRTGKRLTYKLYHTIGNFCEMMVFLFIGIGFFSFDFSFKEMGVGLFVLAFIIINLARYFQVTVISNILNRFRDRTKITKNFQHVIVYSGFRGAMAFALATNAKSTFSENGVGKTMLLITLLYATVTIFVQGTLLIPVLEYYGVAANEEREKAHTDPATQEYCFNVLKSKMTIVDDFLIRGLVKEEGLIEALDSEETVHDRFEESHAEKEFPRLSATERDDDLTEDHSIKDHKPLNKEAINIEQDNLNLPPKASPKKTLDYEVYEKQSI